MNTREVVITGWTIFGQSLRDYLHYQFPATQGHIPLAKWIDKFEALVLPSEGRCDSKRPHLLPSAAYWFKDSRMAWDLGHHNTAVLFMENAYNHSENALAAMIEALRQIEQMPWPDSESPYAKIARQALTTGGFLKK